MPPDCATALIPHRQRADNPLIRRAARPSRTRGNLVDTSYRTDRIYRVRRSELGIWLDEERVDPPVHKTSPRPQLELGNGLFVACVGTACGWRPRT
jgi:hypothetical protein